MIPVVVKVYIIYHLRLNGFTVNLWYKQLYFPLHVGEKWEGTWKRIYLTLENTPQYNYNQNYKAKQLNTYSAMASDVLIRGMAAWTL